MSERTNDQAAAAAAPPEKKFDEWLSQLQEAIADYRRVKALQLNNESNARSYSKGAAAYKTEADEHLQRIVEMMRERCGDAFVSGLAEISRELRYDEDLDDQADDEDLDDRLEPTPPGVAEPEAAAPDREVEIHDD